MTQNYAPTQATINKLGDLRSMRRLVAEECEEELITESVEAWSITRP